MQFKRLVVMLFTLAVAGSAAAQSFTLNDRFDARRLDRDEIRILQGALALGQDYDGLIDGAWGRGSMSSLDARLRRTGRGSPTWRDVRTIIAEFEAERQANGWQGVWHRDYGIWHLRPDGLLREREGNSETRFASADGGLILLQRTNRGSPQTLHDSLAADARRGTDPYRLNRDSRLVTAAEMRGGRFVYARSDRSGSGWITHIILADQANRGRMQLMASSFATRDESGLDPRSTRTLMPLLNAGTAAAAPQPVAPQPSRPSSSSDTLETVLGLVLNRALEELLDDDDDDNRVTVTRPAPAPRNDVRPQDMAATGVRINTTDIITTTDPDVCPRGVVLRDGTLLDTLFTDNTTGLSVLVSPDRSPDWAGIAPGLVERGDTIALINRDGRRGRE